eukprot:TRINITY_DN9517_c0_g1_i3.p1 TRINITY_DN9517_c0_g1~~TRINITY_DN9517_c0_g1_i3.p1  ORF type:complete len:102 (+),score=16.77 TRINITY_DN9517_c0_g1_i3:99-404(+)
MIRRPPRSTLSSSSAASDVYKRQESSTSTILYRTGRPTGTFLYSLVRGPLKLSLIHISEPTRLLSISYAVFCLKKKKLLHLTLTPYANHFIHVLFVSVSFR